MRRRLLCIVGLLAADTFASPSVLNATAHADTFIAPAVNAVLGTGHIDGPIFIDYAPTSDSNAIVAQSSNGAGAYRSVATDAPSNHATYQAINASLCCYNQLADQGNYLALQTQGTVYTQPPAVRIGGQLPAGTPPPVVMVSTSSPNSADGGTTWGLEFALSVNYKGLNTSEDSWDSAGMAGLLLALQFNHPTFNWFDIKAALRITAANWATGYNHLFFGYGTVDWDSANAITDANTIYLQPPGLKVTNNGYYATLTLYPYRQFRRDHEVIYSVNPAYVWPVKNEYTAADIAASGATLLFTGTSGPAEPSFIYVPAASGSITFIAFSTDGVGGFSREEEFSPVTISLTVGSSCAR